MNLETTLDRILPLVPDGNQRAFELDELLRLAQLPRDHESSASGPWELMSGKGLLFSAPHEVTHIRDGKEKAAERNTSALAFALAWHTGASALATTGHQAGDPNWDVENAYVARAQSLAGSGPTIDIHMMRPRGVEVCVGLGPDPRLSERLWSVFVEEAVAGGVRVAVNWPFGANPRTVTGQLQQRGLPAIQLEMSSECFDATHPAMPRAWSALGRAARRLMDSTVTAAD